MQNKFCSVCAVSENKHEQPPQHMCYRNWLGSSASMETFKIVYEGFCLSERHHGMRYMHVTADGDSSVMATLQSVPYGPFIQKIECACMLIMLVSATV